MPKRTLPREILTDSEMTALLAECGETISGLRDRSLILLLDGTGLRIAEALALEPRDLDWEERTANVRHGKGNKQRVVPVSSRALAATRDWLRLRLLAGISDEAPVCCNLKGAMMSSAYVRKRLPTLAARAGIAKRVHPHGFRHRFATRMVRCGVVITSVSQVLGHSQLATTHRYCTRLGAGPALDDVRSALRGMDRGRGRASSPYSGASQKPRRSPPTTSPRRSPKARFGANHEPHRSPPTTSPSRSPGARFETKE